MSGNFNGNTPEFVHVKPEIVEYDINSVKQEVKVEKEAEDDNEVTENECPNVVTDQTPASSAAYFAECVIKEEPIDYCDSNVTDSHYNQIVEETEEWVYQTDSTHTNKQKKEYKCNYCGKICKTSSLLGQHKHSHMINPYTCDLCGKLFSLKQNLRRHKGSSRCKIPEVNCSLCQKSFKTEYLLKSHLRSHQTEIPYTCDLCQKKFKHKTTLARHMQIHSGITPYKCKFCGKGFTHRALLKPHMIKHTGEKPHQCPKCYKRFGQKHNMMRHLENHKKEKKLICDICNKLFPKESRLKYHMKIHVKEKYFSCLICPKKFSHKGNVIKHYLAKHPNDKYDCKETDASVAMKIWQEVVVDKSRKLDKIPEENICIPVGNTEILTTMPSKSKNVIEKAGERIEEESQYILPDFIPDLIKYEIVKEDKVTSDVEL